MLKNKENNIFSILMSMGFDVPVDKIISDCDSDTVEYVHTVYRDILEKFNKVTICANMIISLHCYLSYIIMCCRVSLILTVSWPLLSKRGNSIRWNIYWIKVSRVLLRMWGTWLILYAILLTFLKIQAIEINRALNEKNEGIVLQLMEIKMCAPASSDLDIPMVLSELSPEIN